LLTEFINLVTNFRLHMSTSSGKLANNCQLHTIVTINLVIYLNCNVTYRRLYSTFLAFLKTSLTKQPHKSE